MEIYTKPENHPKLSDRLCLFPPDSTVSLPGPILAGGGDSSVATGSLIALNEQGTPKEAVRGSTPQIGYHVDYHNGEFRYPFMALRVPGVNAHGGPNMDIKLLFTYRSRITYNGLFGYNWDFFYYKRVVEYAGLGMLAYFDGTGRRDVFSSWDSGNNEWDTNPAGYLGKFTKDSGSTNERYVYTGEHGNTMSFDSTGRLYRITDRNGNYIQVSWKANPNEWQIDNITDTTGRDFSFSYCKKNQPKLKIISSKAEMTNRKVEVSRKKGNHPEKGVLVGGRVSSRINSTLPGRKREKVSSHFSVFQPKPKIQKTRL